MHKNATKCNKTLSKWCKNKHGASKIIDTFETYQPSILVGHQDYFRTPLPGSEALLKSGIGKGNRHCEYFFYFCLLFLFYFAMESSPFGFLFGNTTTTIADIYEPPPAQLDPFKIPMKIVEHVMNNCYSGDGTVHPGDFTLYT
jgi:hypothetical protein